jgi:hypothetical protein
LKIFSPAWQQTQNSSWSVLLVIFGMLLILLAIFLVGWTISWKTAGKSFLFLSAIYLGIYTISASWNAGGLRIPYQNEMWWLDSIPVEEDLVTSTINNNSEWNNGFAKNVQIQVVNLEYPSIQWALRVYDDVQFTNIFPTTSNPQMIISRFDEQIAMVDSYRGQDFTWSEKPYWSFLSNSDWETWLLARRIPEEKNEKLNIMLWVRNDLFPGSVN